MGKRKEFISYLARPEKFEAVPESLLVRRDERYSALDCYIRSAPAASEQLVTYPAEILGVKVPQHSGVMDENVTRVTEALTQALHSLPSAFGLASVQIGECVRAIAVCCMEDMPVTVFVNPEIHSVSGPSIYDYEGCFSLPGMVCSVPRYEHVTLSGLISDLDPESPRLVRHTIKLHGMPARAAQHEIDHLNGILVLDRAKDIALSLSSQAANVVAGGEE